MSLTQSPSPKDTSRTAEYIDIAALLIAQKGYERTSVRDIAQAINLTSGTMFYHFRNKADLLEAIISKGIDDGIAQTNEALEQARPGSLSRFHALVAAHIAIIHGELRHVHRVWIQEWDKLSPEAYLRLRPRAEKYRATLDDLLLGLKDDGYLKSDPTTARHLLLPALNWTTAWADLPDERQQDLLGEQFCATVLNQSLAVFRDLVLREAGDSEMLTSQ